jgi:protein-tyrosine phosphatase
MFEKILVICLGNICRSPTAEFLLKQRLPGKHIASAGLSACKHSDGRGWNMCETARATAEKNGLSCPTHSAQQLNRELVSQYDLLLVMETSQRNEIAKRYPEAHAKTMLLGQWLPGTNKDIPDPYKKSDEVYQHVYQLIDQATATWQLRLK